MELIRPAPDRVADTCTHDGEPCPGAPWQGLPYEAQLEQKRSQVDDALRRLGRLDGFELEPIEPSVQPWRYRNKLEYSFGERDGAARARLSPPRELERGGRRRGLPARFRGNNAARNEVREWAAAEGIPAYDPRDRTGVLRNLVVRDSARTGQVQTRLVTSVASFSRPPVDLHTVVEGPGSGTSGPTGALGEEYLDEELCGLRFRVAPTAFFQTNTAMAETLYAVAAEFAGLTGSERVFDLFCGIGTITLTLAGTPARSGGWSRSPEAIADAEQNARRNGIANARFVAADARLGIRPLLEQAGKPDVVVVDPPRAGLSKKVVRRVIECEAAADRLRVLQPDDAGAERRTAGGGGI